MPSAKTAMITCSRPTGRGTRKLKVSVLEEISEYLFIHATSSGQRGISVGGSYTLTHRPTGKAIAVSNDLGALKRLARKLRTFDWDFTVVPTLHPAILVVARFNRKRSR